MILLLRFDRAACKIVESRRYADAERDTAVSERLSWEIKTVRSRLDHEVVMLEAPSEAKIRQTHRRYFESFEELGARLERSVRK